ncbi:hypothetical protein KY284_027071 [Solanum tuberosum]|nr:hypothetical protein KY284_027071 [Solanum tuberosum]
MREERQSEHLQDPIGVQNLLQIQNGNVESLSTRGDLEKDDEERIVVEQDGNEEENAFAYKDLPKDAPHIHCFVNHDIKTQLTKHLTEQQYNLFCEKICFDHYMRMRICVGQGQILRCCMALELECSTGQALVIRVNGTILKFTLRTFALITESNCVGVIDDFNFNTKEPNRLIVQYFGGNEFIRKLDLMSIFTKKVWADNEDNALKFAILYFIHTYVYSGERTSKKIPRIHFDLVESGRYRQ